MTVDSQTSWIICYCFKILKYGSGFKVLVLITAFVIRSNNWKCKMRAREEKTCQACAAKMPGEEMFSLVMGNHTTGEGERSQSFFLLGSSWKELIPDLWEMTVNQDLFLATAAPPLFVSLDFLNSITSWGLCRKKFSISGKMLIQSVLVTVSKSYLVV